MKFKVGDKVKCIDCIGAGDDLNTEKVYTVSFADYDILYGNSGFVGLQGVRDDSSAEWADERFILCDDKVENWKKFIEE